MTLDKLIDKIEEGVLSIFRRRFTKEEKEKLKEERVKISKAARYEKKFKIEDIIELAKAKVPSNYANISTKPVDFNFTVIDDYGILNCSLYMNISGWTSQETL